MRRMGVIVAVVAILGLIWLGTRPAVASAVANVFSSLGSCCGSARAPADAAASGTIERAAIVRYQGQTGDQSPVTAEVVNLGCHVQANIYRAGQRVKSYVLRGGRWEDIP